MGKTDVFELPAYMHCFTEREQGSEVCRTLVHIFSLVNNRPLTANEMTTLYMLIKDHKTELPDRNCTIRSYLSWWNKTSKELQVGQHKDTEKNIAENGKITYGPLQCEVQGFHRVCSKKDKRARSKQKLYWIQPNIAATIFANHERMLRSVGGKTLALATCIDEGYPITLDMPFQDYMEGTFNKTNTLLKGETKLPTALDLLCDTLFPKNAAQTTQTVQMDMDEIPTRLEKSQMEDEKEKTRLDMYTKYTPDFNTDSKYPPDSTSYGDGWAMQEQRFKMELNDCDFVLPGWPDL